MNGKISSEDVAPRGKIDRLVRAARYIDDACEQLRIVTKDLVSGTNRCSGEPDCCDLVREWCRALLKDCKADRTGG